MATSSAMSTSNQYIKYTISITQNSQSIANNTSNVTVSVRFYRTNTGYTSYGTGTVYCKINGTQYSAAVTPSQKITNSGIVLFTKTLDISHGSDGKKTLICSAWISHDVVTSSEQSYSQALSTIYRASTVSATAAKMGGTSTITIDRKSSSFTHTLKYTFGGTTATIKTGVGASYPWPVPDLASKCNNALSGKATITCITYNGSTAIGTETCDVTLTVPSESPPTASNVVMGNNATVSTNRKSTNFTHTIELWFAGEKVSTKTGVGDTATIAVPLTLANKIPSKPSGTATIKCTTYNGTAKVGSTKETTFVATVPNDATTQPQFTESGFVLTPDGSLPSSFSGLFIQGKTGVKANFTATSNHSTISKYEMEVDGRVYTGNPATSRVITTYDNIRVRGIVTDARGYFKEVPKTITVHPYKTPTIEPPNGYTSVVCERANSSGEYDVAGPWLNIHCAIKHSPIIVDGVQKNFCDLSMQYKVEGGSWSTPRVLLSNVDADYQECDHTLADIVTQTDKSYTIRLIVTDTIGESEPYDFPIPTADVTMHLGKGGHGVAFGKYSEATADHKMVELDSDWDLVMDGESVKDFVLEQGTSGNWEYRKWASGKSECWGKFEITATITEKWGSLYIDRIDGFSLPDIFSYAPICVASSNAMVANNGDSTQHKTQPLLLINANTREGTLHTIQFVVFGKWK